MTCFTHSSRMRCFSRLAHIGAGCAALLRLLVLGLVFAFIPQARAAVESAEIVLLIGQGERREASASDWLPAAVKQKLQGGSFVRTLANSQMGLLMPDRTQIRLNQNSQLQIKSGAESTLWTENAVRLNSGRAWSKAQPQTGPGDVPAKQPGKLVMETPSATLSIRGTDWEVEVGPDGQTQLVVLTGVVGMGNEQGEIEVAAGEAAIAAPGKAPVKLVLLNPGARVQWVSSWKPQPLRWLGADAPRHAGAVRMIDAGDYESALRGLRAAAQQDPGSALLAADLLIHQGDNEAAAALLSPHASAGKGDARATALLARALVRLDRLQEAQQLLDAAQVDSLAQIEILLARGELAILQGDVAQARAAYRAALVLQPDNAEAWYGLGLIETERENIGPARELLNQALRHDPRLLKAAAELAAAESFAGNLGQSQALLDELLLQKPANYVALTARGINLLKIGRAGDALDDFLRAGLIEPRYARAWLFSGVAYYQQGERERALQAFARAAALDPRDPIAPLLRSLVQADALDYGPSILAAREAQERMPYLRSLNQVANNQRGSANLGSALASFGMEEWAKYYADAAYSPFWAGSHLFLADRATGKFNKNSELFQGFLGDPTVFGASNRDSALVAGPGHYGRVDCVLERNDWTQGALIGTVNGLVVDPIPMAYYLSGDLSNADSRKDASTARGRNFTLGLGVRPRYDIGIFAFAADGRISAALHTPNLRDDALEQTEGRGDIGINYKLAPDNQFWLKAGNGRQRNTVAGPYTSQSTADTLNDAFGTNIFTPDGQLDRFHSGIEQDDVQFRHSFTAGAVHWTWGVEKSHQKRTGELVTTFTPARIAITQVLTVRDREAYVSARHDGEQVAVQFDLFSQHMRVRRSDFNTLDLLAPVAHFVIEDKSVQETPSELNPRVGVKWQPTPNQSLRLVGQRWRRPASVGQLASVDTLGINVNDRLPSAGGRYQRWRLQYDGESGQAGFLQAFVDHERVDNGLAGERTAISDFELTQLESLRNRPEVFSAQSEIEETPIFARGRVATVGVAANFLLGAQQAVSLRYLRRDAHQQGLNAGLRIPYLARDVLQLGSRWSLPGRWLLGAGAVYRGARFRDDANREALRAGWAFGLSAYWESADKRSAVQLILDNLLSNSKAATSPDAHLLLRYSQRF